MKYQMNVDESRGRIMDLKSSGTTDLIVLIINAHFMFISNFYIKAFSL